MIEATSFEGVSLGSATPPSGRHRGWGTGDGGGMLTGPDGSPTHGTVGFFFGNTELSLELWTTIAGISGFDD
jgi:hypothetical protein